MSETNPAQQNQPGQVVVHVDETQAKVTYANAWQMNAGQEEIICDLGVQLPRMIGNQQAISFQVGSRIVFSPTSAMRFAAALQQVIAQREQRLNQATTQNR